MAFMASRFHKQNNELILYWVSVISGISLIGFGIYFAFEAIRFIFF